jgi:2-keto-3-deoxy-L-rhamnonate aldolase RhmA
MRENRLRTLWKEDKAAVNGWLAIPNSFSAETMAHQGWDTLTIDMQHGVIDYADMVHMLQAISTTATVPIVRVPWLEPGILMKALDAGAYGVICPMVNTREDAQKLVAYTHYAPQGTRGQGLPLCHRQLRCAFAGRGFTSLAGRDATLNPSADGARSPSLWRGGRRAGRPMIPPCLH